MIRYDDCDEIFECPLTDKKCEYFYHTTNPDELGMCTYDGFAIPKGTHCIHRCTNSAKVLIPLI